MSEVSTPSPPKRNSALKFFSYINDLLGIAGSPHHVLVNMLVYDIEFNHLLHYCIHFWINTLGKSMNHLFIPLQLRVK